MSSLPSTPVFVDTPVSSDPHTPDGHSPGILQSQQTATIDPYTGLAVLPPLPSHGAHPVVVAPPRVDSRASQHSPASRPDSLHTATVIVNDHLEQHLLDADGCLQSHRRRPDDALAIVERLGEEDHTTEDACVPNAVLDDYLNETLSPQNIRDHGPTAGPMRYAVTPPIARRTLYLLSVYDASVQEMLALENADAAALWRMDPDGNLVGRLQSAAALSEILATFTLTQSRLSSARAILTKRLQLHQGGALRRPRASRSPARRTSPLAPARAVTPIAPSRTASPAQPIPFPPPAASAPGFLSPRTSYDNQKLFSSSWWELLEGIREQWMTPTFMSALALEFEGQRFRQPGHTHESPFDFFGRRLLYYRMTHQSTTPRGELYAIMKNAPPGWDTVLHVDGIQDTRFFLAKVADKSKELVNWTSVFEVEPEDDTWQSVVDLRTAPEAQRDYWAANPEVR
ncbi:hypothetical protein FA95DRAFT_1416846 [Auriscalpium vulgare]|uniref:Uncharacterized protein n=1 Tax=Auriscalpium vulgare TaxID=40419 RepID=A0ACB8R0K7_9AGAM|nr:hypothetical protein FA95DRAFT_1416846 [Auriscalpium vulgare]